jgi:uncharacterized protein (DUF2345 family)
MLKQAVGEYDPSAAMKQHQELMEKSRKKARAAQAKLARLLDEVENTANELSRRQMETGEAPSKLPEFLNAEIVERAKAIIGQTTPDEEFSEETVDGKTMASRSH